MINSTFKKVGRSGDRMGGARFAKSSFTWEMYFHVQSWASMRTIKSWSFENAILPFQTHLLSTPPAALCDARACCLSRFPQLALWIQSQQWRPCPLCAVDGPAAAIKLQFMFGLITGKKCDREGSAYSLTHANGCYNQQPPASRLCENQAHTQRHSDHLVFAGTPPHNIAEVWQLSNQQQF